MTRRSRRARWPYIIAGLLVFFVLLVIFLPTLMSTSAGNRWVLGQVNRRIDGQLSAERVSWGWLSGFSASGLVLKDERGRVILDAPSIETELSLLGATRDTKRLGKTSVDVRAVNLVSYPDATTNASRVLGPSRKPAEPTATAFTGDVNLRVGDATWTSAATKQRIQAKDTRGTVTIDHDQVDANVTSRVDVPRLAPTLVRARVSGKLDRSRDYFVATDTSFVEEGSAGSGGQNRITLANGGRISFGDGESNAPLTVRYDLARLGTLLAPFLPEGLSMSGKHQTDVLVQGRLLKGEGLAQLRKLRIARAELAYDRVAFKGLVLTRGRIPLSLDNGLVSFGNAKLPANGGTITLAGRVDINGKEPVYELDESSLVLQSIDLNAELANGPFKFLPISWGSASTGSMDGTVTAKLEGASLPFSRKGLEERGNAVGSINIDHLNASSPGINAIAKSLGPVSVITGGTNPEIKDESMRIPFALEDGRLSFSGVEVDAGQLDMSFSGSVGVDGTLDAKSTVKAGGFATPAQVAIGGTVRKPDVKVTASLGAPEAGEALEKAPGAIQDLFEKVKP